MPARRSSLTSRSCSVPNARSTRPFACGLLAQRMSMFSSLSALHPKNAVLVAVERNRLAMRLEIAARRTEIIECRFRGDKSQMHQSAGRVVDKREQCALLRAVLKPRVFRSVNLHQLARAIAPAAW